MILTVILKNLKEVLEVQEKLEEIDVRTTFNVDLEINTIRNRFFIKISYSPFVSTCYINNDLEVIQYHEDRDSSEINTQIAQNLVQLFKDYHIEIEDYFS